MENGRQFLITAFRVMELEFLQQEHCKMLPNVTRAGRNWAAGFSDLNSKVHYLCRILWQ
jgi:hypothetical protein